LRNAVAANFSQTVLITSVSVRQVAIVTLFRRLQYAVSANGEFACIGASVGVHRVCIVTFFANVRLYVAVSADFVETVLVTAVAKLRIAVIALFSQG